MDIESAINSGPQQSLPDDDTDFTAAINEVMAIDDADDPLLETYQRLAK